MRKKKAQSSTEYLVIVAAVAAVALVAAGLLASGAPPPAGTRNAQSASYWSGQAAPIKVSDWGLEVRRFVGAGPSVDANLTLTLFNPGAKSYVVRKLKVAPGNFSSAYARDGTPMGAWDNLSIALGTGEQKIVKLRYEANGEGIYVPPASYNLMLNITYDGELPGAVQEGKIGLAGQAQETNG